MLCILSCQYIENVKKYILVLFLIAMIIPVFCMFKLVAQSHILDACHILDAFGLIRFVMLTGEKVDLPFLCVINTHIMTVIR